ncbi:MAG: hypothetical protein BROFUL_02739 [Candidatus Brocadia fulgida]|uniref:Uncharacterized protein n=1 Tax=Candidatus Brocadia fulgida TaxID=380242 RepID=A0A0M2UU98_9BACT|nr:MAG: hypothetical protein BROFUL_02739 [Candidatus Brocadia fulgida]
MLSHLSVQGRDKAGKGMYIHSGGILSFIAVTFPMISAEGLI